MASPGGSGRFPASSQAGAMPGHPYPLHPQMSAPAGYPGMGHPQGLVGASQMMMGPGTKEFNIIMLCRLGQELVHDLVAKTSDLFQSLNKHVHLPNGVSTNVQTFQERRQRIEESTAYIKNTFAKLRTIYKKLMDVTENMDIPEEQMVVMKGGEPEAAMCTNTDSYRQALEEHRLVVQQVRAKNTQLKEIIDHIRAIIWEINTMMSMRKAT